MAELGLSTSQAGPSTSQAGPSTSQAEPSTSKPGPATFLKLIPYNPDAKRAFNDLVAQIPDRYPNAARFIFSEPHPGRREPTPLGVSPILAAVADEDSQSEFDFDPDEEPIHHQGFYFLAFDVPPELPRQLGWVLGAGRWGPLNRKPHGGVDVQLALPDGAMAKYQLSGRHAHIYFDKDGTLVLSSMTMSAPNITLDKKLWTSGKRWLLNSTHDVEFGRLQYTLQIEHAKMGSGLWNHYLERYFEDHLNKKGPNLEMSKVLTPSEHDITIGDWTVKTYSWGGGGPNADMSAAKNGQTGEVVAVKHFRRATEEDRVNIAREIKILEKLPDHPHMLQVREVLYKFENQWLSNPHPKDDPKHDTWDCPGPALVLYMPYSQVNMREHYHSLQYDPWLRLFAFRQLLQGVAKLHSRGIIHRKLTFSAWGIVNRAREAFYSVITDYSMAEEATTLRGNVGTAGYQAPETQWGEYGNKVDIWSCGIIGVAMFFTEGEPPWEETPQDARQLKHLLESIHEDLQDQEDPLARDYYDLLAKMLVWNPADRLSAEEVLLHPVFIKVSLYQPDNRPVPEPQTGEKHGRS